MRRAGVRRRAAGPEARLLRRPDWFWALGLTGLGLLIRVVVVSIIGPRGPVFNDSSFYLLSARALATGHGYSLAGLPTAQWPPGYSAVLSVLFRVFWFSEYVAQVFNAVIGALTIPALFVLVHRVFGRRPAVVAAAVFMVLPGPILWADVAVAETLYTFVVVLVLLVFAFTPRRWWAPLVFGFVCGLATLVRGEGMLFVPAAFAVLWARRGERGSGVRAGLGAPLVRVLGAAALVVLVFALTLLPWGLRNSRVMGQFVPLSTNSSTTLWSGHNAGAQGGQNYAPPELLARIPAKSGPQRELGEGKLLRSEAIRYARSHPSRELQLIPLKLVNLIRGDGYVLDWVNAGPAADKPISGELVVPVRVVADGTFYAVFAAALLAMAIGGRRLWRSPVLRSVAVLFGLSLVLYGFVYYGNYRYREPLTPLLLLVASPLLARVLELRGRLVEPEPDPYSGSDGHPDVAPQPERHHPPVDTPRADRQPVSPAEKTALTP